MSILHDALRRREAEESGRAAAETPAPAASPPGRRPPQMPAALLATAGVFAAAFLAFLLTRPSQITVITPPPEPAASRPVAPPPRISLAPPVIPVFEPLPEGYRLPPPPSPAAPVSPPGAVPFTAPPPRAPENDLPPDASDFRSIPVHAGARPQSPEIDLPPGAMMIEMSEATLESLSGEVTVNGLSAQPGSRLRVGSNLRTAAGAAASLGFARAGVELGASSTGKITRLERRSTAAGPPIEDVTLHLTSGDVRAVVRPGGGSVLVSTDQLTAMTASGAFRLTREADGGIRVKNEGGAIRLIPTARQDAAITLAAGEEVVYRDGAWSGR